MPTIKDIAHLANVSICTVSRYLNDKIVVRKETEERILSAICELGYVPNAVAQSLKRNSTSNVAVILPRITTSYYSDMTGGISSELSDHGYNLFIYEADHQKKSEHEMLQLMRENMVAGVIFISMSYDTSFLESLTYLSEWHIPVVYANRHVPYTGFPLVYPNFEKVGQLAAEHLIAQGKRRLALLQKPLDDASAPHVQSFREVICGTGLPPPLQLRTQPMVAPDDECINCLLQAGIDGVFVQNELLAVRTAKALMNRGLSIPEQIAVLGFGNSVVGEISTPELSCIDLQNNELGVQSARLILQQISHANVEPITLIEPSILPRRST